VEQQRYWRMALVSLIDPKEASDAGGVAGRTGFRYQDHVGAGYVIDMLRDSALSQVEFETADDLTLRWIIEGQQTNEYVQVKTTEGDNKWSIKEIATRDNGREWTSLMEKSLSRDVNLGAALFRFVSRRDVGVALRPFLVHRDKRRIAQAKLDAAVKSIGGKFKTLKSQCGRTTTDWAKGLLWEVAGSQDAIQNKNVNRILQLAETSGEIPSYSSAGDIYTSLMRKVQDAGDASRVSDPDAKAISRDDALAWWQICLDNIRSMNRAHVRVYRVSSPAFFSDLHAIDDVESSRSLRAYDVEFDDGQWRKAELIEYLLEWLPEIALPARVLAEFDHLQARELTQRAVSLIEQNGTIADNSLLAELMLHAVLRHYFDSEPIACKIYYGVGSARSSTSAHLVSEDGVDQLWIGRSRVTTAGTHAAIIAAVTTEMEGALLNEVLREERRIIVSLREPRHMRASSLETVLSPRGKMEELRRCLHLPILVAYDSTVISAGFAEDYLDSLRAEVTEQYEDVKSKLTSALSDVQVHVFLIPVENPASLVAEFGDCLRGRP